MLEVHPPHESVRTWKDFLIHIATITIGLLIALGLEATVEMFHHRNIVAEARQNIRTEITKNQTQLAVDLKSVREDEQRMLADMDALRLLRKDPNAKASVSLAWSWSGMSESAWLTARDTGALTHMPYEDVQGYADLYFQQQLVNDAATALIRNQTQAEIPLIIEKPPAVFTPAQIDEALHRCAEIYVQLQTLESLIASLDHNYAEALRTV